MPERDHSLHKSLWQEIFLYKYIFGNTCFLSPANHACKKHHVFFYIKIKCVCTYINGVIYM